MRTFTLLGEFFLILAAVSLVAVLLHLAFRHALIRGEDGKSKPSDPLQPVIGAMFALSMAFMADDAWTKADQARDAVDAEARSIRLIEIYADPLDSAAHEHLDALVSDYAAAAALEWEDMGEGKAGEAAEQDLKEIYDLVIGGVPADGLGPLVQQRLLVTLDGLSAARQKRLSIAQDGIRRWQWFLAGGLALILLVVVAAVHPAVPAARARALAITVAAITVMIFVVLTYQRPFGGGLSLTPEPILEAAKG